MCKQCTVMGSWLQRGEAERSVCVCVCVHLCMSEVVSCVEYAQIVHTGSGFLPPSKQCNYKSPSLSLNPTLLPFCPTFSGSLDLFIIPFCHCIYSLLPSGLIPCRVRFDDGIMSLPCLKISPTFFLMPQQGSSTLTSH